MMETLDRSPIAPTVREIQIAVAERFGITPLDLVSQRRGKLVARARQVGMWVARHTTTHSLPVIGREFGGRDHTTVMHAIERIDTLRTVNRELDAAVLDVLAAVGNSVDSVDKRRSVLRLVA